MSRSTLRRLGSLPLIAALAMALVSLFPTPAVNGVGSGAWSALSASFRLPS